MGADGAQSTLAVFDGAPDGLRPVRRRHRTRVAGLRLRRGAALAALAVLTGAPGEALETTTLPQLFGSKYVLQRFTDRRCINLDQGQGATQSWVHVAGTDACYELSQGYQCTYRCIFKFSCKYKTGSGVVMSTMSDLECSGAGTNERPFAPQMYWLQALDLFQGKCVPDGYGKWLMFATPLNSRTGYPDCSSEGDVEPGTDDSALRYEHSYDLAFFEDTYCGTPYQVTTYSDRQTSAFTFKVHRGVQHCYDMVDTTDRGETTRDIDYSMLNFRFVCGNVDSVGNGIMVEAFSDTSCTGRSSGVQKWKDVFYPMNFPDTMDLLRGKCVRWGKYSAKFTSAWLAKHFPDCTDWACKDPAKPCTGGRVTDPSNTVGTLYSGSIRTSGGDPTWPLASSNRSATAAAPRVVGPRAVALFVAALVGATLEVAAGHL